MSFNSLQLAAGYDQVLSNADNIEAFDPMTGLTISLPGIGSVYCYVDGNPEYSRGQARVNANAGFDHAGFEVVVYRTPRIHVDVVNWLIANYEGQVTVNLRRGSTSYAEYNAILRFVVSPFGVGDWRALDWNFTLVEAL